MSFHPNSKLLLVNFSLAQQKNTNLAEQWRTKMAVNLTAYSGK
jgi:hypothetical protein